MGQRLNLEIRSKNKLLANAYYHWSGYTMSSAEYAKIMVAIINDNIHDRDSFANDKKYAAYILAETGARFYPSQENYAKKYGFTDKEIDELSKDGDRNWGYIALRPCKQKNVRAWEEARVSINIDTKTINFNALWWMADEDVKDLGIDINKLPEWQYPVTKLPFAVIFNFFNFLETVDMYFRVGNNVYAMIA